MPLLGSFALERLKLLAQFGELLGNEESISRIVDIAGVVNLNGKDYYMGVAVRKNNDGTTGYYAHDAVIIEKRNLLPNKSGLDTAGEKAPTLAIILSELADYNRQIVQNPDGVQFADPTPVLPSPEIRAAQMADYHAQFVSGAFDGGSFNSETDAPDNGNLGERQFTGKTLQRSMAIPMQFKNELFRNPRG